LTKRGDSNSSPTRSGGSASQSCRHSLNNLVSCASPLNKVGSLNKINKAFSELEQEYEREPSPEELADSLEIATEEVETTLGVAARHVSMDAPFVEGEDNSLLDVLENSATPGTDEALEYRESLRREIERSLSTLTERQCDVIKLYFRHRRRTPYVAGRYRREIWPDPRAGAPD
jgi:DNA-directed RNA polymerase sigma subunit (sigma70/sigma32)